MKNKLFIIILIIICLYLHVNSQIHIDYTNSQIYTFSAHSNDLFLFDVFSEDTIADTTQKIYGSIVEAAACTITCEIIQSTNNLNVQFGIVNQHNGYNQSKSTADIHLPLIIDSTCGYTLTGKYDVKGIHVALFQICLYSDKDTLFETIQISNNQNSPSFNLSSTNGDSVNVLTGDTTGTLQSGKKYTVGIHVGIFGKDDDIGLYQARGQIGLLVKLNNTKCIPYITNVPKSISSSFLSNQCYNLLGRRLKVISYRTPPHGLYIVNNQKLLNLFHYSE